MTDIYEFHVTGLIGPVVRSALPELTSERDCRRTLLSGSAEPGEVTRILEQLRDSGLLLQHVVLRTERALLREVIEWHSIRSFSGSH